MPRDDWDKYDQPAECCPLRDMNHDRDDGCGTTARTIATRGKFWAEQLRGTRRKKRTPRCVSKARRRQARTLDCAVQPNCDTQFRGRCSLSIASCDDDAARTQVQGSESHAESDEPHTDGPGAGIAALPSCVVRASCVACASASHRARILCHLLHGRAWPGRTETKALLRLALNFCHVPIVDELACAARAATEASERA